MKIEKIEELANRLYEAYKDYGVKKKEIFDRLRLLLVEFKVPEKEAINTITNYLVREYRIPREEVRAPLTKIAEIKDPNMWVSVKAKVLQLWEPSSPSIAQTGMIGDETGTIRFLIWAKAGKPEVEEGKCYVFRNVVSDEFMGVLRLNVTRYSDIEEIDEDIEVKFDKPAAGEVEIVGALVAIHQNSGLVQRCVECGRIVKSGNCPVHGRAKWYDDLRLRGVIDDGENTYEIIMGEDVLRELIDLDLERARRIAEENLDRAAVLAEMRKRLLGKYLRVEGTMGVRFLRVTRAEFYRPEVAKIVDELLEAVG